MNDRVASVRRCCDDVDVADVAELLANPQSVERVERAALLHHHIVTPGNQCSCHTGADQARSAGDEHLHGSTLTREPPFTDRHDTRRHLRSISCDARCVRPGGRPARPLPTAATAARSILALWRMSTGSFGTVKTDATGSRTASRTAAAIVASAGPSSASAASITIDQLLAPTRPDSHRGHPPEAECPFHHTLDRHGGDGPLGGVRSHGPRGPPPKADHRCRGGRHHPSDASRPPSRDGRRAASPTARDTRRTPRAHGSGSRRSPRSSSAAGSSSASNPNGAMRTSASATGRPTHTPPRGSSCSARSIAASSMSATGSTSVMP